jgi:alpha-mannosidase
VPPVAGRIETIYLIHHSHTDVGYTHDQPVVWELQRRFLDAAIELAEADADREGDDVFRWTVETTAPLLHWLRTATDRQVERLLRLERAGRIEVTAMLANVTPLFDTAQLIESLQPVGRLRREFGLRVEHAMNCDVNGQNWTLVEVLLDAGISGFGMSINEHFGGAPLARPGAFWWEGPSGRRLLAWNGWHYMMGNQLRLGVDVEECLRRLPEALAYLEEIGYPLPAVLVQTMHPFGDNGSAWPALGAFVRAWNGAGHRPRVVLATPRMWWEAVRPYADRLPVHRGDWTDFWNFGCISSAREQAVNRQSRARLWLADALWAVEAPVRRRARAAVRPGVLSDDSPARRPHPSLREEAWLALHLWDEHTWGADVSVGQPEGLDTRSQWVHKASYAYRAHSLSVLLQRDAAAELARRVRRGPDDALVVFNPLPWPRVVAGPVPVRSLDLRGTADDPTSTRHAQDRASEGPRYWLPPTEVPGFGYAVVPRSALRPVDHLPPGAAPGALGQTVGSAGGADPLAGGPPPAGATRGVTEAAVVENHRHRLTFDRETGGIRSWWDKSLGREWVDAGAGLPLFGFVYETVADGRHPAPRRLLWTGSGSPVRGGERGWQGDWRARRLGPEGVVRHTVRRLPSGTEVLQYCKAPGVAGLVAQRTYLPDEADYLLFEAWWEMGLGTHPEATYLAFPFALPDPEARVDIGGQAVRPGRDQLPGAAYDYFTVQRWVALSGAGAGVIVATPDNPMVQLGGFHFGRGERAFRPLERALLLGWVTNNYWETNFRAHQPGRVTARYAVLPFAGELDEAAAHRFGAEMAQAPLFQTLQEPPCAPVLPERGSWLRLPEPPVLVLGLQPGREEGTALLRLWNASDGPRQAEVGSALLTVASAAVCDVFGGPLQALPVQDGAVTVTLPPRRQQTLRLELR